MRDRIAAEYARLLSVRLARVVARAAREHSADRLYSAGATHVVSPYVTSGRRMASLVIRPHVVEFFDLARTAQPGLRLEELQITEGSALAGRSLRELRGPAVPPPVRHADGQMIANSAPTFTSGPVTCLSSTGTQATGARSTVNSTTRPALSAEPARPDQPAADNRTTGVSTTAA